MKSFEGGDSGAAQSGPRDARPSFERDTESLREVERGDGVKVVERV